MARTYLFYDTETSGLSVAFDQVLRFAAIRTDERLREISRHALSVRLRPDVVPAPEALLTAGLSLAELQQGPCEFEAMAEIHALFNTPETVTLGYNTLGYDDELLRFSFFRNLLPPYAHQFSGGCGRMDLLPMTVMVRLLRPEWLTWPEINGRITLKLEPLSRANGLANGRAHDAMVDTEATLELARRYSAEVKKWEWLCALFDREEDRKRQSVLPELRTEPQGRHRLALMVNHRIGPEDSYIAPVVSLGSSIPYKNQTLWLRLDHIDLAETTPDNVAETTRAFRKKDGDSQLLLNLKPRYVRMLRGPRLARTNKNRRLLEECPEMLDAITDYYRNYRYPVVPEIDADASLYADFLTPAEEAASVRFRKALSADRAALAAGMPTARLRALARRVLGRNFPDAQSEEERAEFAAYLRRVDPVEGGLALVDYKGGARYTPHDARAALQRLSGDTAVTTDARAILTGLADYLGERFGPGAE